MPQQRNQRPTGATEYTTVHVPPATLTLPTEYWSPASAEVLTTRRTPLGTSPEDWAGLAARPYPEERFGEPREDLDVPAPDVRGRYSVGVPLDESSFFSRELRDVSVMPGMTPSGIAYALRYAHGSDNSALDVPSPFEAYGDYAEELGNCGRPRRSKGIAPGTRLYTIHVGTSEKSLDCVRTILKDRGYVEAHLPLGFFSTPRSQRGDLQAINVVVATVVTLCHGGTYIVDKNHHTTGVFDDEQWVRDVNKVFPNAL